MKLILATHNEGKTVEMQHALSHLPLEVITLNDFPHIGDIPETGNTLVENSFIKAETVFKETGIPALADDTGLEIDVLNGAPGVYSARHACELSLIPISPCPPSVTCPLRVSPVH